MTGCPTETVSRASGEGPALRTTAKCGAGASSLRSIVTSAGNSCVPAAIAKAVCASNCPRLPKLTKGSASGSSVPVLRSSLASLSRASRLTRSSARPSPSST